MALGLFAEDVSFDYGPLLAEIAALGATHVSLIVPLYQEHGASTVLKLHTRLSPSLGATADQRVTLQISGQGQPNASYSVEAADSLTPPIQWTNIASTVANAAGQLSFTVPDAVDHPMRFYRFVLQ